MDERPGIGEGMDTVREPATAPAEGTTLPAALADALSLVELLIPTLTIPQLESLSDATANLSLDAWRERRRRQGYKVTM